MTGPVHASAELQASAEPLPEPALRFDVIAAAALDLPGLKLNVDGAAVGIAVSIDLTRHGSQGFIDVKPTFRLPTGAGAELALPGVTGGGYLAKTEKEFRGVIAADLGFVKVSGFGLLGIDDFSLLVLLAAEFRPPIQLSFGFTLVGVGGLVGINRRADVDAIAKAVSSGDLSRLLFPRDPVGEAPELLATLSACFPYDDGGIVVGPMVKVGWGTPTIIAATVGVIVSTANGGVIIVGRLAVTLPFEDLPIIRIEALFVATIDANGFALDASLVNSQLAFISIEGDIRVRMRTGSNALFAISAGGFHPAFTPPEGMAGMRRIAAECSPGSILKLRLEAYAAITSSSLQFGARVELTAGVDGFGIHGHLAFDALFVTEPSFGFNVRLSASVSVECADFDVCAIELTGELSGPSPWRIRGSASISILFFEVDVDIPDISWGSEPVAPLPARDPLEAIVTALQRPESWTAGSAGVPALVMLRPGVEQDKAALHPLAAFQVRQRSVPLDTVLQRMDGRGLARPVTVTLQHDRPGNPVREPFLPSQFFALEDDKQLQSASFADLPAGIDFGARAPVTGPTVARDIVYEQKVLAEDDRQWRYVHRDVADVLGAGMYRFIEAEPKVPQLVEVRPPRAVVASILDLRDVTAEVTVVAVPDAAFSPVEALQAVDLAAIAGVKDLQLAAAWEVGG